jgi:hypothetical protein
MAHILTHFFALATVFVIGLLVYALLSPEIRLKIRSHFIQDDLEDHPMIQKCLKDSWDMQAEITDSTSKAELQSYYWEVDHFESAYSGLVPDRFLKEQSDRLYNAITLRRDQINGIVSA